MAKADLTAQRLRASFNYDPVTGVFTRLHRSGRWMAGGVVGYASGHGYLHIAIDGTKYLAHRLAFLYTNGVWPAEHIDHRDGDILNNRWSNLRDASRCVNMQNIRACKISSKSGFLGVSKARNRWSARLTVERKRVHLGYYATPELAHAAYLEAKRRLHVGCTI